jgi:hypothetical protein
VQYLYVHAVDDAFAYTSTRGLTDPRELAALYLECALVQSSSLALGAPDCEQVLVTNLDDPRDPRALTERGVRLVDAIEELGVELRQAPYAARFEDAAPAYESSRYVLDAMGAATATAPDGQVLWFSDVDCVWIDPSRVFATAPPAPQVACLRVHYPPHWDVMLGTTPTTVGEVGRRIGTSEVPARWVGGELLGGTSAAIRALVTTCAEIERELGPLPYELPAEEHLFTLAGALGRVDYRDLAPVARRIFTGLRRRGPRVNNVGELGFWHLPGEKGLSLRRTADRLLAGERDWLAAVLADPRRREEWFNVSPRPVHRLRDASWLTLARLRSRRA